MPISKCERCNGSGIIPHLIDWRKGKRITCPDCKGHGNILHNPTKTQVVKLVNKTIKPKF